MQSIEESVLKRIQGRGKGTVFVPADFLDLGSRRAVDLCFIDWSSEASFVACREACTTFLRRIRCWEH